ncbi:MAG: hypothetical protein HZA48_10235 [Planctomycetes bacterium]|nr:hypothetical protein [Planctomycetota bacterium]
MNRIEDSKIKRLEDYGRLREMAKLLVMLKLFEIIPPSLNGRRYGGRVKNIFTQSFSRNLP